jgi:hypothetical protein
VFENMKALTAISANPPQQSNTSFLFTVLFLLTQNCLLTHGRNGWVGLILRRRGEEQEAGAGPEAGTDGKGPDGRTTDFPFLIYQLSFGHFGQRRINNGKPKMVMENDR